jgi:hypothetical protein
LIPGVGLSKWFLEQHEDRIGVETKRKWSFPIFKIRFFSKDAPHLANQVLGASPSANLLGEFEI